MINHFIDDEDAVSISRQNLPLLRVLVAMTPWTAE